MRQLTYVGPGRVEWQSVPEPEIGPTGALVKPLAVARCDLDPVMAMAGLESTYRRSIPEAGICCHFRSPAAGAISVERIGMQAVERIEQEPAPHSGSDPQVVATEGH